MKFNELYDVVDKKGNKIGVANWTECHTKGLLHQCVHGILFRTDEKKEILMKKRSYKMVQEPGAREIAVAGHLLFGETPKQGIIKEFQEELFSGNKLPQEFRIKKVGTFFNSDIPNNHELVHLFEIICPGPFFPDSEEVDGKPMWINLKKLLLDIKSNTNEYARFSINALNAYLRYGFKEDKVGELELDD